MKTTNSIIFGGTKGIGKIISKTLSERGDRVITASRKKIKDRSHLTIDLSTGEKEIKKYLSDFFNNNNFKIHNVVFCQRYRGKNSIIDFNVTLHSTEFVIENIKKRMGKGSSIIFISSIAIKQILDDQPMSYHLTRAALNQMSKYYAVKLGKYGIRCNCILPTKIIKPENKKFYLDPKNKITKLIKKITPLNIMGDAKDVANLTDFLTSKKSTFLTGLTIPVDGGTSLLGQEFIANKLIKFKR